VSSILCFFAEYLCWVNRAIEYDLSANERTSRERTQAKGNSRQVFHMFAEKSQTSGSYLANLANCELERSIYWPMILPCTGRWVMNATTLARDQKSNRKTLKSALRSPLILSFAKMSHQSPPCNSFYLLASVVAVITGHPVYKWGAESVSAWVSQKWCVYKKMCQTRIAGCTV